MSFHISAYLTPTNAIIGGTTILVLLFLDRRRASRRAPPYPPGPRPLPIIGNILDMPQSKFSVTWSKLGDQYGPLTYLSIPGRNVLVVNSLKAAKELLENRALIYIDRSSFTMAIGLLGLGNYLVLSPANEMWRKQRSHLKHALSGAEVRSDYSSLLEAKARQYLERCATHPDNALPETNRIIGEIIIKLTYGKLEDARGRDYIQIITRILDIAILSLQGYVVDLFPALRYLPKWLPGMKFKRDAARWAKEIHELEETVFELFKENALSDDPEVQSSYTFKKMQEIQNKTGEGQEVQAQHVEERLLNFSGLQIFFGGLETTEATMRSFIYAMILSPSVQKKAQDEIDRVIGSMRLPTFEDQSDLPFLNAVVLETLRWNPVVSFGVPHVSRQDDVYEGYCIPKGTTVIPNAWGFSRDPKYYTNPSIFDPERHLKQPPELDPREFVFGFGRRICPGKDLAFQEVWILAASILWAFNIVGEEDVLASLADVDRFTFGAASHPIPFKCQFVSRRDGLSDISGIPTA